MRPRSSLPSVLSDLHGDAPGWFDDHGLFSMTDAWMGNAGADASNGNRHFRGQAIIKAVFSELQRYVYALAAGA